MRKSSRGRIEIRRTDLRMAGVLRCNKLTMQTRSIELPYMISVA